MSNLENVRYELIKCLLHESIIVDLGLPPFNDSEHKIHGYKFAGLIEDKYKLFDGNEPFFVNCYIRKKKRMLNKINNRQRITSELLNRLTVDFLSRNRTGLLSLYHSYVNHIHKIQNELAFLYRSVKKGHCDFMGHSIFGDEIRRIDFKIDSISDAISCYNTDELLLASNQLRILVKQCYVERYNGYICSTKLYNVIKLSNNTKVTVSCDCVYHSIPAIPGTGVMIIDLRDKHSVRPYLANRLVNKYSNPFTKEVRGITVQKTACNLLHVNSTNDHCNETRITYFADQKSKPVIICSFGFLHFSFGNIVYTFYIFQSSTIYLLQSVDPGSDTSLSIKIDNSQKNRNSCLCKTYASYCGDFVIASFSAALIIKLLEVFTVE